MSEAAAQGAAGLKLEGLVLHKLGMASIYGEAGEVIPVTMLRFEPLVISQVKTKEKDGYEAVQIAGRPLKAGRSNSAEIGHFKGAGFQNGAAFAQEIRQALPQGVAVGAAVSLETLTKGDIVTVTSRSKGKGFMGSVRRFNFAGGPAAHGSKFHRQPGSSGNRTWPGRVMPGKKFPGHMGDEVVSVKNVKVVQILPEEGIVMVKGPVPGARNTIVTVMKQG